MGGEGGGKRRQRRGILHWRRTSPFRCLTHKDPLKEWLYKKEQAEGNKCKCGADRTETHVVKVCPEL